MWQKTYLFVVVFMTMSVLHVYPLNHTKVPVCTKTYPETPFSMPEGRTVRIQHECENSKLNISSANSNINYYFNISDGFKLQRKIEGFRLESCAVKFLPKGIMNIFPSLKSLQIRNTQLQQLTIEDMNQFGNKLEYLTISNNSIRFLPAHLFDYNPKLKILRIYEHRLNIVEGGFFENLNKLYNVYVAEFLFRCMNQSFERNSTFAAESFYKVKWEHACYNNKI